MATLKYKEWVRFEPVTIKIRLGEHTINVPMPHVDNTRAGDPDNQ